MIRRSRKRGYRIAPGGVPAEESALSGTVHRHRDGYGFLVLDDEGEDLFLPAREMRDLMDGDRVRARPVPGRFGRTAGRVVRVVSRARSTITGVFRRLGAGHELHPDPEIFGEAVGLVPGAVQPRDGEVVEVEILEWPQGRHGAVGRVVEVLGSVGELGTIVQTLVRRHRIRTRFSDEALDQAAALPERPDQEDLRGRKDLRNEPTFTIDGADARDFDDAVSVLATKGGGFLARISIADVAHWVEADSPLDREAAERGTSTYLPDRVLPMLPERLSNGLASLVPGQDRLTLTAELTFDSLGARTGTRVYESVIRSLGRWTYGEVARVLDGEDVVGVSQHRDHVQRMHALMGALRARRRERGALDLDLPEPVIRLGDHGRPIGVERSERHDAHRVIEELMIAANEAVAEWLVARKRPAIFRVHAPPDPERLREFVDFARSFGHVADLGGLATSAALSEFLARLRGATAERAIQSILLRSMMRAEYAEQNIGHYGLASERYLHFTSPIRRYPDLVVHRQVKAALPGGSGSLDRAALARTATSATQLEAASDACERAVLDVMRAAFLEDHVGEEHEGVICGVIEDGFFVELQDHFVEGMVRVEDLDDDWYSFVKESRVLVGRRRRRRFAIGDPVRVVIQAVHVPLGRVDLRLAGGARRRGARV